MKPGKKKSGDKKKVEQKKHTPKWYFLILILIPILFFVLLETGLRIFNYGTDYNQWVEVSNKKYMLNPDVAKRYFYNVKRVPLSIQDLFDIDKKPGTFRVFVLGGSSAAGYPFSPLGAFSRYIKKRLELVYPETKIEVVNIGLTAVNSYTIRDLFPGVLEQKPDLVLIYAGHNEYYGALGVGSMESLGTSRSMVNLILYLNKYKTVELLRNIISGIIKLFSEEGEAGSGTLMSRMAKDQYIAFNSDTYKYGISQFEGNLHDVLKMAKENNVPVILSTLSSNLKGLKPFVSIKSDEYPEADKIFSEAEAELNNGNKQKADSLFRYAKDLDGLRFRAPEEINTVINSLGKEFNCPVINVDSVFESESPDGITGNNLMTDHLHPTLEGYQIIGKIFYEKMAEKNLLPDVKPYIFSLLIQDSVTIKNFEFTKFDSTMSDFRIKLLKNDWPFVEKGRSGSSKSVLVLKTYIDSLASDVVNDKITWEKAHRDLASFYLKRNNITQFLSEMDALISQYPIVYEYYEYVANNLILRKDYDYVYKYLKMGYEIKKTAYMTKWMGTLNLFNNNLEDAEKYLKESLSYDNKDPQVWYNLAGVFVKKNEYKKALDNVNKALELKPNYPEAAYLKMQLQSAVR